MLSNVCMPNVDLIKCCVTPLRTTVWTDFLDFVLRSSREILKRKNYTDFNKQRDEIGSCRKYLTQISC